MRLASLLMDLATSAAASAACLLRLSVAPGCRHLQAVRAWYRAVSATWGSLEGLKLVWPHEIELRSWVAGLPHLTRLEVSLAGATWPPIL